MNLKRDLLSWIRDRRILVGDGAMGTMLQNAGLEQGACPEVWNLEHPVVVQEIMQSYLDVGSEILETNTFGGSPQKLECYGLASQCSKINREGARIGREIVGEKALILGSMGSSGILLEPLGPLSEKAAFEGFKIQAQALAAGGADALCVETMIDLNEATAAVRAACETGLPVVATMTFESTPRGYYTVMGIDVKNAALRLAEAGAAVIGANCGTGGTDMVKIARLFREHTDRPLIFQSNAGLPVIEAGNICYPETPEMMASFAIEMAKIGVSIIGGCCGSTPAHIRAVAKEISLYLERT